MAIPKTSSPHPTWIPQIDHKSTKGTHLTFLDVDAPSPIFAAEGPVGAIGVFDNCTWPEFQALPSHSWMKKLSGFSVREFMVSGWTVQVFSPFFRVYSVASIIYCHLSTSERRFPFNFHIRNGWSIGWIDHDLVICEYDAAERKGALNTWLGKLASCHSGESVQLNEKTMKKYSGKDIVIAPKSRELISVVFLGFVSPVQPQKYMEMC